MWQKKALGACHAPPAPPLPTQCAQVLKILLVHLCAKIHFVTVHTPRRGVAQKNQGEMPAERRRDKITKQIIQNTNTLILIPRNSML